MGKQGGQMKKGRATRITHAGIDVSKDLLDVDAEYIPWRRCGELWNDGAEQRSTSATVYSCGANDPTADLRESPYGSVRHAMVSADFLISNPNSARLRAPLDIRGSIYVPFAPGHSPEFRVVELLHFFQRDPAAAIAATRPIGALGEDA
jgi:hypothetical protein